MPVKLRRDKARHLDGYRREQLLNGPDACLLGGVGYLTRGRWAHMPKDEQAHALAAMRADWAIYGPELLAWWRAAHPGDHGGAKPWQFVIPGGEQSDPWALKLFGVANVRSEMNVPNSEAAYVSPAGECIAVGERLSHHDSERDAGAGDCADGMA